MSQNVPEKQFARKFAHHVKFKQCDTYEELKAKVRDGVLFPAIRENTLDFYCSGQRAVRRTRDTYKSNDWFVNRGKRRPGAKSKDISFPTFPFKNEYGEIVHLNAILDMCRARAQDGSLESYQLSKVYTYFSFASIHAVNNAPILLDVEARFASLGEAAKTNKDASMIDLVFLLPEKRELLFVEGKRRFDPRIRKSAGKKPEVVDQVLRYKEQLEARKNQIIQEYTLAAEVMDDLFGFTFITPKSVLPEVPILVVDDKATPAEGSTRQQPSKDTWLEPELAASTDTPCKIWHKDGVWLMDARGVFMPQDFAGAARHFAQGLNALAEKIRR
ncbi:MAG: hypothetical protein OEL83_14690 [Desulforhopalus sp.]|nr:hypothetical protein [Desulforhopalus sp.]